MALSPTGSRSSGGFTPVSCVLALEALSVRTATQHLIVWDSLYDNAKDFNALAAIPTGLGLTFLFNGTSANITTTAAGIWSFAYNVTRSADATWVAQLVTTGLGRDFPLALSATSGANTVVTDVLALPSGATIAPTYDVAVQATGNPYEANTYLSIVRLA